MHKLKYLILIITLSCSAKPTTKSSTDNIQAFKCKNINGWTDTYDIILNISLSEKSKTIHNKQYYALSLSSKESISVIGYFSYHKDTLYYLDVNWNKEPLYDSLLSNEQPIYVAGINWKNQAEINASSEWLNGCKLAVERIQTKTNEEVFKFKLHYTKTNVSDYKHLDYVLYSKSDGIKDVGICTGYSECKSCTPTKFRKLKR